MLSQFYTSLSDWGTLDTWIAVTAAFAAMACSLPGVYLVLRRQSMMGDALSHTTLPGIVFAFLLTRWLTDAGWLTPETGIAIRHGAMFAGAMVIGVFSAMLTEWIQTLGRVESSAALGVVFTTLFALGLLALRIAADDVHIDPDCVLYGTIETVVMDPLPGTSIPRATVVNGSVLLANAILVLVFYKELRISTFDPGLATALGINARIIHYVLMAVTATTLVAAFESVGSILVVAMLIVPAATAYLLTDRLGVLLGLSLVVATLSAFLGHAAAITLPSLIFTHLGFPTVVDASTAGMIAATSGVLFLAAMLFGPRYGLCSRTVRSWQLSVRIAAEDLLGSLYRQQEDPAKHGAETAIAAHPSVVGIGRFLTRVALQKLKWDGKIVLAENGVSLTDSGSEAARHLVRSHRLWETYMARHFELPDDHLHETAERVEHFMNPELTAELEAELDLPDRDPHGKSIPTNDDPRR